jgi:radical SAM superfamily enzyme YgiQ (UPF0313 family)
MDSNVFTGRQPEMTVKKVAFVYLSYIPNYVHTGDSGLDVEKRPKLGLQYLCAVLEQRGIMTNIFDQIVVPFTPYELVMNLKGYDMVGFYCSDPQEKKVKEYCSLVKQNLIIPINVGGPATANNSSFLEYGCDVVVHGEGEVTILQLVDYYNGVLSIESVNGVSYRKNGITVRARDQPFIEDLDTLPFPYRKNPDVTAYYDPYNFSMGKPFIHVMSSRGCLYRCHFCASCKSWGYQYRQRSVDNVLAEIDAAVEEYGELFVCFQDDVWGRTNRWIEEFCTKLIDKTYKIRWLVLLHPFSIPTDKDRVLELMKRAGCVVILLGLQSAHPYILLGVNRNPQEPARLKELLAATNNVGILTAVSYIFGLPGDTPETIRTTIDYSVTCGATLSNYFNLSILHGSKLEEMYKEKTVCEMPTADILALTRTAYRKFYTHPQTVLRVGYYLLQYPNWIVAMLTKMPLLFKWTGVIQK